MKPLYKSISECFKKNRYKTEEKALKYAKKAEDARGTPLRTYYCRVCLGFHLTHKKKGEFDENSVS